MTELLVMSIKFVVQLLEIVLIILSAIVLPFVSVGAVRLLYYRHKGVSMPKRKTLSRYSKRSLFKRLFFDFPDRVVTDMYNRNPDAFPHCGVIMVVGEQGAGKTVTVAHMLYVLKQQFPEVKILSNTPMSIADGEITSPDDIVLNDNGEKGCIKVLDEIQNWFNSAESQYFPPEMLSEISQQRKQHSLFIGTSQRFDRVSKAIRQQTHYIIKPLTLLGALTVVRVYKPRVNDGGEIEKMRRIKTYCFVQTDVIRNSFDTYAKIKRLSVKGWKPRSEQDNLDTPAFSIAISTEKPKTRK